jgi:hypothetical protein
MYLDDLISGQVDPQTAAIYLSPSHLHTTQDPALTRLEAQVPSSRNHLYAVVSVISWKNLPTSRLPTN